MSPSQFWMFFTQFLVNELPRPTDDEELSEFLERKSSDSSASRWYLILWIIFPCFCFGCVCKYECEGFASQIWNLIEYLNLAQEPFMDALNYAICYSAILRARYCCSCHHFMISWVHCTWDGIFSRRYYYFYVTNIIIQVTN